MSGKELVAAGHDFAKTLDADAPMVEVAKLVSDLATRLDCAIARGDELQQRAGTLAAENAVLKSVIEAVRGVADNSKGIAGWHLNGEVAGWDEILPEINDAVFPLTNSCVTSLRAEGIHFAVNRMLAAWGAGFIEATPGEAADVAGAVLSALEFLPNAHPDEFNRAYADKVISEIRTGETKQ
nr:hypothetical protein [Pantoea ananatis]